MDYALNELSENSNDINNISKLFNITINTNFEIGKDISRATDTKGVIIDNPNSCVSEKIPYTWNGYAIYDCVDNSKGLKYTVALYDVNDTCLTAFGLPSSDNATNPRNINFDTQYTGSGTISYLRMSFAAGTLGEVFTGGLNNKNIKWKASINVIGVGNTNDLQTNNKSDLVNAVNELHDDLNSFPIVDLPIKASNTNFFYSNGNLCDPSTDTIGEFVNQTNGIFSPNSNHRRTDYIEIEPDTSYCVTQQNNGNTQIRYAFYDNKQKYLDGDITFLEDINYILTSPDNPNTKYLVISVGNTTYKFMVKKSTEKIDYEPYICYLLPKYIYNENTDEETIINLPNKIYALVGYETNIYFENLVEGWTNYNWDVNCGCGIQLERGFRITPTVDDVGEHVLTIKLLDKDKMELIKSVSSTIIVTNNSTVDTTKNIIILGDSTTNSGTVVAKIAENLSNSSLNINTLGTRGTTPQNHEGRSGWRFSSYFETETITYTDGRGTVNNPFYNPTTHTFDAEYYFNNTNIAKPDWFFINLGINDTFSYNDDDSLYTQIESCINMCDAMINSINEVSPNTKIGVCLTIPPNHSQDAFGKSYKNNQYRNRYKRNNVLWVNSLISKYDKRESDGIYTVPIHLNLDTVYNMGFENLPVNSRNTDIMYQSPVGNGGVHPSTSGYWQIADVYTAFIAAYV